MSIEQLQPFHQTRRLLKAIAPDFRLLANSNLEADQSVIDVTKKTIEVGEETDIDTAVAILLFQIGHVGIMKDPTFSVLFGEGIKEWEGEINDLIDALAEIGAKADLTAARWAIEVINAYFSIDTEKARQLIDSNVWSKKEWREYFSTL